jgi:hypothetical protein
MGFAALLEALQALTPDRLRILVAALSADLLRAGRRLSFTRLAHWVRRKQASTRSYLPAG